MSYAQRCKACEEVFILEARVESCPSCAAPMPVKKRKTAARIAVETLEEYAKNPKPPTWQEWKDSEPGLHDDEKFQCAKTCRVSCKTHNNAAGPSTISSATDSMIPNGTQSNDVITEFLKVNEKLAGFYTLLYGFMSKNTELIKSKAMSSEDMCDFGFFCREAENTLDELRKEVKARKELCGQIIAARKTQESLNDPAIKLKVTGQYATGSPDVKMQAQLPKKFTDEYYQLTDYFGIDREIAATGVLRLDWKATGEFITQLANDGKPTPEGFGKQYPTYVTTFRRKRKS